MNSMFIINVNKLYLFQQILHMKNKIARSNVECRNDCENTIFISGS